LKTKYQIIPGITAMTSSILIKIDGKRAYRLAVFDPLLNVPVTEEIAANIEYNTIRFTNF